VIRKLALVVSVFFVIFLIFFLNEEISTEQFKTDNLNSNVSVDQPIWLINQANSKVAYKISANNALVNKPNENFLLARVVIKELLGSKVSSSVRSDKALLDLGLKNLIMSESVHLELYIGNEILDLFTNEIICDLNLKEIKSEEKITLEMPLFVLESEGFQIKNVENKNKEILFNKAAFNQSKDGDIVSGKADLIIHNFPSDVLTLKGSAEVKFNSSTLKAEEIQFNYKSQTIIKSKNSKFINS